MVFGVNFWLGKKALRENQQQLFVGSSGMKLYFNPEAYPETWVVHEAVSIPHDMVLESFQKYDLEKLRQLTFIRDTAPPRLEQCSDPGWTEVTRRDTASVLIQAELRCTGMVVLNDAYYPGWVATVDGQPSRIYEADGIVRGVVVPAGKHRLEMRYRPKSVYWGAALTGLGLLGACLLARYGRQRLPQRPTSRELL